LFARQGYNLEDATELSLKGDLDVESVFVAHLPSSPPSFSPQSYLEMSEQWKASPLPTEPVELFIGILSAAEAWRFQMQNSRFFEIDHGGSSSDHGTYLAECPEPHAATVARYYDSFIFFSYLV